MVGVSVSPASPQWPFQSPPPPKRIYKYSVDGAKHLMRNRKNYRLLRSFIRGLRRLLRPHVFAFGWRVGSKVAAHWAVGEEEDGKLGEEWEEEDDDVTAAGSTRSNGDDDCDEGEGEGPEGK